MFRKRISFKGLVFILLMLLLLALFSRTFLDAKDLNLHSVSSKSYEYQIQVNFDPGEKKIICSQRVKLRNNSSQEYTELFFHIYPNVFKTADSAPFPKADMSRAYPEGFAPGYMIIHNISGNGEPLSYEIDDTILKVKLTRVLKPGKWITIDIDFTDIIPPSYGRYGYGKNTFNIGNWYPILAVYDERGWNKDPYYAVGDPFYSDVATYRVSILAPEGYTIAATGSLEEKKKQGQYVNWAFTAGLVRDFAWVASDGFEVATKTVGDTRLAAYYMKPDVEAGKKALEVGASALEFFNEYFGQYPYKDYAVVASDFYIGGMEYPNLVMIGRQLYSYSDDLEYVVAHETAHQWWYGVVGNNEVKEPWLDEALTEYSTVLYYEHKYGREKGEEIYDKMIYKPYAVYEATRGAGAILRSLDQFSDWMEYSAMIYSRGAIMFKKLEAKIGKDTLHKALRFYYRENMYKNATTSDFIKAINRASGVDWSGYIYKWLQGTEPLQQAA